MEALELVEALAEQEVDLAEVEDLEMCLEAAEHSLEQEGLVEDQEEVVLAME